jgi:hypothetical protein
MAKTTEQKSNTDKKASTAKPKAKANTTDQLLKVSEEVLKKFQSLGIEKQLQADLEWCLGSYRHDKNPVGLLGIIDRSITILKGEQLKKTKGVTEKLITDLEKAFKLKA